MEARQLRDEGGREQRAEIVQWSSAEPSAGPWSRCCIAREVRVDMALCKMLGHQLRLVEEGWPQHRVALSPALEERDEKIPRPAHHLATRVWNGTAVHDASA